MSQKKIGILGGMGPDATLLTYSEIIRVNKIMNPGKTTPHIIINSIPYDNIFENLGDTVSSGVRHGLLDLIKIGANVIGISCNTAHLYINQFRNEMECTDKLKNNLQETLNSKFVHLIEEAAYYCYTKGYSCIGLISTPTSQNLYQVTFGKYGIKCIFPSKTEQNKVDDIINKVLQHTNTRYDKQKLIDISLNMMNNGADKVILGCTELPVMFKDSEIPEHCISSISILVQALLKRV